MSTTEDDQYIKNEHNMGTFKKEGRISKDIKLQGNIKQQARDKDGKRLRKMSQSMKEQHRKKTTEALWKDKHQ